MLAPLYCKNALAEAINSELKTYREKRENMKKNIDFIIKTINDNIEKAKDIAESNIRDIYKLVGLKYGK